jgi:hypothetical protein
MSTRHFTAVAAALTLVVACASDGPLPPPEGFQHAAATRACGPADGPAVAIYLVTAPAAALVPPAPYVRINVWQSVSDVEGGSWEVGGDAAAAAYFTAPNDFEVASDGWIRIQVVGADTTVEGSVDLTFPNAGRVAGGFRAVWISAAPLCG